MKEQLLAQRGAVGSYTYLGVPAWAGLPAARRSWWNYLWAWAGLAVGLSKHNNRNLSSIWFD
jgi:hypothetical protein